jgi:hypothetical protein
VKSLTLEYAKDNGEYPHLKDLMASQEMETKKQMFGDKFCEVSS